MFHGQKTTPEIFWKKFKPAPAPDYAKHLGDCWIWQGATKDNGNGVRYGVTSVDYKQWNVHRLAYTYAYGEIPAGLQVRHACDVGVCGRPEHLSLGTAQDNANDRVKRNRQSQGEKHSKATEKNRPRGEKHFRAQFTNALVLEIRRLHDVEHLTPTQIAIRIGKSREAVGKITRGERWRHVV